MCRSLLVLLAALLLVYPVRGQETRKIPISFLPPPLETATYSLGIYDAKTGRLVRRLQEGATQDAFTVGLNGLITNWDGKDDAGKMVLPGKYAARGYAVGALKVDGESIIGNDWAADDENLRLRHVDAMAYVSLDGGVAVLATMADDGWAVMRFSGDGKLLWRKAAGVRSDNAQPWLMSDGGNHLFLMPRPARPDAEKVRSIATFSVDDGQVSALRGEVVEVASKMSPLPAGAGIVTPATGEIPTTLADPKLTLESGVRAAPSAPEKSGLAGTGREGSRSAGKDGTTWTAGGVAGLVQTAKDHTVLRRLEATPGDPLPCAVAASPTEDRLYLLEEKEGWQRLRGLSWVETKQEDGKPVSTWQTFFERDIRLPDPALGLDELGTPVEIGLVENPLDPGRPQKVKLQAKVDDAGSYLVAADGLRLRRISQRANLKKAKLIKSKSAGSLTLYQDDGAAWDEFSIEGVKNMMAFDAGEIDMTADGEKTHPEKASEPPDL